MARYRAGSGLAGPSTNSSTRFRGNRQTTGYPIFFSRTSRPRPQWVNSLLRAIKQQSAQTRRNPQLPEAVRPGLWQACGESPLPVVGVLCLFVCRTMDRWLPRPRHPVRFLFSTIARPHSMWKAQHALRINDACGDVAVLLHN
jgi:hypothetical protein